MATISPRKNKDGEVTYRVIFRRKGLKTFTTTFTTRLRARQFVSLYEQEYCLNPKFTIDRLKAKREREFGKRE